MAMISGNIDIGINKAKCTTDAAFIILVTGSIQPGDRVAAIRIDPGLLAGQQVFFIELISWEHKAPDIYIIICPDLFGGNNIFFE